jgi:hypothetical protein
MGAISILSTQPNKGSIMAEAIKLVKTRIRSSILTYQPDSPEEWLLWQAYQTDQEVADWYNTRIIFIIITLKDQSRLVRLSPCMVFELLTKLIINGYIYIKEQKREAKYGSNTSGTDS